MMLSYFAETQEGLQTYLHLLNQYCLTSALSVNTEKTKVVIFNKQKGCSPDFRINMKEIQVLSDYKYLGIVLSDNCSFKPTVLTLATQAKKSLVYMCPILEYGCEVWIATAGECLEMVHKTFCKSNMLWAYQFPQLMWHAVVNWEGLP